MLHAKRIPAWCGFLLPLISAAMMADDPRFLVRIRGVSFPQKDPTQVVYEFVNYASHRGPNMFRIRHEELKDDIYSNFEFSVSTDHGRTWSDTETWRSVELRPEGRLRHLFCGGFFDPGNDRLLLVGIEGMLRNDHPLDGQTSYYPFYRVSNDGGRS